MKAISDVIAMLLMLVVTIGLVGLAYSYITGVFTSRMAVVLSVDPSLTSCASDKVTVYVRNDGNQPSGQVVVNLYYPDGTKVQNDCKIPTIPSGVIENCVIPKQAGISGNYRIVAVTQGSSAQGQVYCVS